MTTTNKQPQIDITFKQLATTAIQRGSRGKVALIIFDDTDKTFSQKTYKLSSEVDADKTKYTLDNYKGIKDCFVGIPAQVTIYRLDIAGDVSTALTEISKMKYDWIGTNAIEPATQTAVAQFIKEQEALKKYYKAVVFKPTLSDCKHVVELVNTKVTFKDDRGEQDTFDYIPTALGVLAGLSLNRSATFLTLNNIESVIDVADIDVEIGKGKLVMFNDDGVVRFSTAVNSLTTLDINNTEIMTKIENIEIMDLIYNDIFYTFRNSYIGTGKNTTDRQFLFISAVNTYLKDLAGEELLDPKYNNRCFVDVESQRQAWKAVKGDEVDSWTDEKVINTPFRNKIFLAGDVKLLESIENLKFGISLF